MASLALILFLVLGAVSAADSMDVLNTEDSNLMADNADALSTQDKLEISSEDSISETNIVNSHDDVDVNSDDDVLTSIEESYCDVDQLTSEVIEVKDTDSILASSSTDSVVTVSSSDDVVSADGLKAKSGSEATPVATKLIISDTHYAKSATYFDVTLKDKDGNALANQKVTLKVNGKTYSGVTDKNGMASIKAKSLAIGSYQVELNYAGNENYEASSLSKKVKVASSITASDFTKYHGQTKKYQATFWKDGSALAKSKVSFKVNGKTYTKTTNSKGVATISLNLAVGKYSITVINPYSKEQVSHKIVIKKDKSSITPASKKIYINSKSKGKFSVTLKSSHGAVLKNKNVKFTYNNKVVTSKTNAKGKASITIPVLAKGTYKITYKYAGDGNHYSASGSGKFVVHDPVTKLSASNVNMKYNDGSKVKVKLTNDNGKVLANKKINIKINGKSTYCKTDSKGHAKLKIKNLNPGLYKIKCYYSKKGSHDYSFDSSKLIITKSVAKISAKNLVMKYNDGSSYQVTVKDKSGKALKNVFVKSTINNKIYLYSTNSKGVAKLKISKNIGYYPIKTIVADPCYKSSSVSKHILVDGTKFVADDMYVNNGKKCTYSVKAINGKSNPLKNKKISFQINGKTYSASTNTKGIAKLNLGVLAKGTHAIKYSQDSYSGSSNIYVVNKVTIKQIISASNSVKKYINKNGALPGTVKIGDVKFKTSEYLYLASKAIVNLNSGKKGSIAVVDVDDPSSPKAATNLGSLKNYNSVAKKVVNTAVSKGKMPNSVSSSVGNIGYKGIVYAFSRVVDYYGDAGKMPTTVSIKSISGSSSLDGNLNPKNTIKDLSSYLAASLHCEVNNAQIKKLVAKLTKDCKSDKAKANAIYTYVRDTISYSFYYDTKYGAVGTLKAKTGNCVDHTHLLVAMFRTAGLAARYVHGTCTFSSGSTYGHVWAQVLIGNTWTVADATSSRNSLGKVANWNTNSYKLQSISASISF